MVMQITNLSKVFQMVSFYDKKVQLHSQSTTHTMTNLQECVAVLIELYKRNVTVSCVEFDDKHHRTQSISDYAGIPC